jgi:hypothetical protein
MRLSLALLALSGLSLTAAPVYASSTTFTFTISGVGYSGSGTLTGIADPSNAAAYDLTSGSGTLNGTPITLNYTPGVDIGNPGMDLFAGASYNNVLYPSGASLLDGYGLDLAYGSDILVPYFSGGQYQLYDTTRPFYADVTPISFAVTAVAPTPEPSGIVLLGTGIAGAAILMRRRLVRTGGVPLQVYR